MILTGARSADILFISLFAQRNEPKKCAPAEGFFYFFMKDLVFVVGDDFLSAPPYALSVPASLLVVIRTLIQELWCCEKVSFPINLEVLG
jgi:hypothetical protein